MSLESLKRALDELDDRTWCEGTYRPQERLAIALPDGDVGAADDPHFVDWLLEHSELAPFGNGGETKLDPRVRNAQRLVARGQAGVVGFDPANILGEIEEALSPGRHLAATLTDVLVYPTDGRFARHKDTPYTRELVGTLVVGFAIPHTGGAFVIDDGGGPRTFDWSVPIDSTTLRWVALFSDVDHEINPVGSGARVTLVYSLSLTDRPRRDPRRAARLEAVRQAVNRIDASEPVLIACARQVITDDPTRALGIDALRGTDREIAEIVVESGLAVVVRSCIVASPHDGSNEPRFSADYDLAAARLAEPLPPGVIAGFGPVTFAPASHIVPDGLGEFSDEEFDSSSIAPYLLDAVPIDRWVIRLKAAATLVRQARFADDGYFGNGGFDAFIYTLAALEVTRRNT